MFVYVCKYVYVNMCRCVHMCVYACDTCGKLGRRRDTCGRLVGLRCSTSGRLGDGGEAFQWMFVGFEGCICVCVCIFEGSAFVQIYFHKSQWTFIDCREAPDTM